MIAVIYFQVHVDISSYGFKNPLLEWAKLIANDLEFFDLDSRSDALIFSYAEKLAEEAEKILLIIDVNTPGIPEGIVRLNQTLLKNITKSYCLVRGENSSVFRLFKILGEDRVFMSKDENSQKEFIKTVLIPQ